MFQKIPVIIGQYRPLNSFLHRLDTRAKIIPILTILLLSIFTDSIEFYLVIQLLLIITLLYSGIEFSILWRNLKPIFILISITALYHLIFAAKDSDPYFSFAGLTIRSGAVHAAVYYSLRLFLFISTLFLVTLTSSPSDLGEAVIKTIRPLEKLKVRVSDFGLILFIALRFIPILYDEFNAIKQAQMIRGVNFSGSFFNRIHKVTAIIIPVFIAAIHRADELAEAIQSRGYRSSRKRSFYSLHKFGLADFGFMVISTSFIVLLYYLTS